MIVYLSKRIAQTVLVLFGITLITFMLLNVIPGDPVKLMLEKRADTETIERVRHELGIDKPLPEQYFNFLKGTVQLDFGSSYFTKEPVMEALTRSFMVTIQLALLSYLFAIVIGVMCGILAAANQGKPLDTILMTLAMTGISAPNFWIAILLQIFFGLKWDLLPISGFDSPACFILPGIALGTRYAASIARITRTSMLDVIRQDYIRTARAKGLSENVVIFKHALKNAMIPVVTLSGMQLGYMLTGSILIEQVFSISGIGKLTIDSMLTRDLPMLQGAVVYIASIFVITNLLVDISYAFIDPRIRFGNGE